MVNGYKFYQLFSCLVIFFSCIKHYKYFYLDFSVRLLTKVYATGDGWELEPKGA